LQIENDGASQRLVTGMAAEGLEPGAGPSPADEERNRTRTAGASVRVALLEDQRLMRESLAELLSVAGLNIVLSAGDPSTFLSKLHHDLPEVAVIDLTLESGDGLTVTDGVTVLKELRQWHPDVRALVLSANRDPQVIERCYLEGAAGYLYKLSTDPESLVAAIRAVARGDRLVPLQLANSTPERTEGSSSLLHLTAREREVLAYIAGGADNLKIATFLKISERTVKAHVSSLYRKLGPENRAQLALLARQLGVRPPQGL
jgi:DNA-binding NarL/FixJ family response regulator